MRFFPDFFGFSFTLRYLCLLNNALRMEIIEQQLIGKNPKKRCEDGIVVTPDFIAVIDGSTSKSSLRHSLFSSNGRYCMQLVSRYLRKAPKSITCEAFCRGVTAYVRKHYRRSRLELMAREPWERMCASAVIFSRVSREVWMIGDCQCLLTPIINGNPQAPAFYDNPKPYEQQLAEQRAAFYKADQSSRLRLSENRVMRASALSSVSRLDRRSELQATDKGRALIIPHMKEAMLRQNIDYAVIDGFPIPQQHVRKLTLDFRPWEIVLASDGYPFLCPTLQESEERLARQLSTDPMNILDFKATKGLQPGNLSFDDRAYIRFVV